MKIGIFGGCFNPPHNMHRDIGLQLLEKGYLDKVIYVPTSTFYKKRGIIDFEDRYNMLEIMTNEYANLEVSRVGSKEYGEYTYQVLDYYQNVYKDSTIYFICGLDNLSEFDSWKKYEYILENYKLLVVARDGYDREIVCKKYDKYTDNIVLAAVESKKLSSSEIRCSVKNNRYDDIENYLDKGVFDYMVERALYR